MLEQRGNLPPEEIHKLASKTKVAVGAKEGAKASCHSDVIDTTAAQRFQKEKLVTLRVKEAGPAAE